MRYSSKAHTDLLVTLLIHNAISRYCSEYSQQDYVRTMEAQLVCMLGCDNTTFRSLSRCGFEAFQHFCGAPNRHYTCGHRRCPFPSVHSNDSVSKSDVTERRYYFRKHTTVHFALIVQLLERAIYFLSIMATGYMP